MPRKSTGGSPVAGAETNGEAADASTSFGQGAAAKRVEAQQMKAQKDAGIDQFDLPKTNITRLAKSEIPDNVQLRKEVVSALVKSSTVFISYLTATAHDMAKAKSNKTISAANVIEALKELDFPPEMRTQLKDELEAFRDIQVAKRRKPASDAKSKGKGAPDESMDADVSRMEVGDNDEDPDETMAREDGEDGEMLRENLAGDHGHDDDEEEEEGPQEEEPAPDQG